MNMRYNMRNLIESSSFHPKWDKTWNSVREKWDFSLLLLTLSNFYKWNCNFKKKGKSLLHFELCHYSRDLEKKGKYGSYKLQSSSVQLQNELLQNYMQLLE